MSILSFLAESNAIEGVHRIPTNEEVEASVAFLRLPEVDMASLKTLQSVYAPMLPLRHTEGMDVRVAAYVPPPGGPGIAHRLSHILLNASGGEDPWNVHVAFAALMPFLGGNGQLGRMLWAWSMQHAGHDPFAISFLHRWYYQTLSHVAVEPQSLKALGLT